MIKVRDNRLGGEIKVTTGFLLDLANLLARDINNGISVDIKNGLGIVIKNGCITVILSKTQDVLNFIDFLSQYSSLETLIVLIESYLCLNDKIYL